MSNSSVNPIEFTENGLVLPTEQQLLDGVYADYNAAFGGNLNPAPETPQGQLISSTAAIIADANNVFAEYVNQVDPDIASGFMQDAIGRIYFIDRIPATSTVVECQCIGLSGTVIPAGSLAADGDGNIYASIEDGTIGVSGTVTINFANLQTGAIPCPEDSLNKIYQAVTGWDSINNAESGSLGSPVESRADFEYRRRASVAVNAAGSLPSIYASVASVANVQDVYVTENETNVAQPTGATSYNLAPHSLYVAAVGGTNSAIAKAIWLKKNVGCNYNGNRTVTVTDDNYPDPKPSYNVKFQRPTITSVKFAVRLVPNAAMPSNIVDLVKAAIITAFTGADGGSRARIAGTIYASRYYAGILKIDPRVEIISVLVGLTTPNGNSVSLGIDQAPAVSNDDITVQVG